MIIDFRNLRPWIRWRPATQIDGSTFIFIGLSVLNVKLWIDRNASQVAECPQSLMVAEPWQCRFYENTIGRKPKMFILNWSRRRRGPVGLASQLLIYSNNAASQTNDATADTQLTNSAGSPTPTETQSPSRTRGVRPRLNWRRSSAQSWQQMIQFKVEFAHDATNPCCRPKLVITRG